MFDVRKIFLHDEGPPCLRLGVLLLNLLVLVFFAACVDRGGDLVG